MTPSELSWATSPAASQLKHLQESPPRLPAGHTHHCSRDNRAAVDLLSLPSSYALSMAWHRPQEPPGEACSTTPANDYFTCLLSSNLSFTLQSPLVFLLTLCGYPTSRFKKKLGTARGSTTPDLCTLLLLLSFSSRGEHSWSPT